MNLFDATIQPEYFCAFRNAFVANIADYPRGVLKQRDMRFGISGDLSNQYYRDFAEIGYTLGLATITGPIITAQAWTGTYVAGLFGGAL